MLHPEDSVDPDQSAPTGAGAVCSGPTLYASILNSPVTLGNYLQQTTIADDIFRCIFFLALVLSIIEVISPSSTNREKFEKDREK